jgi:hypothetical protein
VERFASCRVDYAQPAMVAVDERQLPAFLQFVAIPAQLSAGERL